MQLTTVVNRIPANTMASVFDKMEVATVVIAPTVTRETSANVCVHLSLRDMFNQIKNMYFLIASLVLQFHIV